MTRLQSVTFQTDTQGTTGLLQSMRGQKLHSGQIIQIQGSQFKVFHINPMCGIVSSQTQIDISRCSFNQELQQVQLLNLSAEKKNSLIESLVGRHLSQDEVIEVDGLKFQVIYCKPESGNFSSRSMYRISNSVKPTVTEVTFSACLTEVQKSSMMIALQKYYRTRRYVREGSKVIIDDTELYVRQAKPKKGFLDISNCLLRLIDPDVNTVRSMFDEEEELGLQLQVNTLKVLQDKTASRNQFVNKRKKLYSLVEGYASYDEKENCIVLSSRDMQSNSSINEFPNFPNTFLCKLHEQKEEDDLSDLESDLMDADETNCMGALEQNEKLTQMTLPVFFKNILASGRAAGASRQTRLSQPEQPRSRDLSFESSEISDEGQHNIIEDYSLSDSSLMHEDQPHLTAIPRYFNEIVMFNSNRRLPIVQQGSTMLDQLPERTIDINWIQSKGSQNTDFSRCMICLMDYNHDEVVRTLPCCNNILIFSTLFPQGMHRLLAWQKQKMPHLQNTLRLVLLIFLKYINGMYKPKKNPVIPRLQNLGSINEYGPLSCRSNTKNTNFIQTCQTTRNAKENAIKIPLKQSKSPNTSVHKKASTQTAQVLKVLNSNVATPEKIDEQDLYYQIIKQRTQQKHTFCSLHTTKKAKFFIHPNNRVLLCSLCAIQEAYDGKAIIWSLDTNEQIPKRLQEDEWTIINSYPQNSERYKKVEQLQSLLNTAKQLYQQVKALKETSIGNINVCDILDEVQQISKDIIQNVNNIVEHLDSRPFQLILQKYIQRLQHYEKIIPKHKQIYISFSNKETFQSADSIALRQSETHRFINDFNSLYSPNF